MKIGVGASNSGKGYTTSNKTPLYIDLVEYMRQKSFEKCKRTITR